METTLNDFQILLQYIREYVMEDTVRKENFTDIEIDCEDDNCDANDELDRILDMYTMEDCIEFLKNEGIDYKKIIER